MDVRMVDLLWGEQSYQEVLQSIYFLECLYCWHWIPLALPIDHIPPIGIIEIPLTQTRSDLGHLTTQILISLNLLSYLQMKSQRECYKTNGRKMIYREI